MRWRFAFMVMALFHFLVTGAQKLIFKTYTVSDSLVETTISSICLLMTGWIEFISVPGIPNRRFLCSIPVIPASEAPAKLIMKDRRQVSYFKDIFSIFSNLAFTPQPPKSSDTTNHNSLIPFFTGRNNLSKKPIVPKNL
jgi:hypothetical protein